MAQLNRDIFTIKVLYKTFFDISYSFRDILKKGESLFIFERWFHLSKMFVVATKNCYKFMYLPFIHLFQVLLKSEFSGSLGSLVRQSFLSF